MRQVIIAAALALMFGTAHADEELERRIDALQRELDALKSQIKEANGGGTQVESAPDESSRDEAVETASEELDDNEIDIESLETLESERKEVRQQGIASARPSNADYMGPAQRARDQEGYRNTTLGGYGEINYNNYRDSSRRDEFDLQRFIIFLGHKFNERTRLFSEVEFEHSFTKGGDSSSGEVAMEQAFIEYDFVDNGAASLRSGLMLLPVGIINEYHEPPTFYGVERPEVETRIIPSTWRELGFAMRGIVADGLEYNSGISTTPDASLFTNASAGFRSMRAQGNRVTANEFGLFAGLNYRGVPGLLLGGSFWGGNTAQNGQGKGANSAALQGVDAPLFIWDLHTRYSPGNWDFRALYTAGTLGDTEAINMAAGLPLGSNKAAPEEFWGWYVEAAYHIFRRGDIDVVPFARYEAYNTQESVAPGYTIDPLNDEQLITAGLSLYVDPQVVFKLDFQDYKTDDRKDRWNVGIGWMF